MADGFTVPSGPLRLGFNHLQERAYATGAPSLAPTAGGDAGQTAQTPPPGGAADTARAWVVGGEVVAGCELIPFVTLWGEDAVPMGGIGGVAALPEQRRHGYTRRVLAGCLAEMRERGMPISFVVTPFSYAFYRRMGWGYAFRRHTYRMPVRAGAGMAARAQGAAEFVRWAAEAIGPEEVPEALDAVYLAALRPRYQGIARRDAERWRRRLEGAATHAYVWRGPHGPSGYLILLRRDDAVHVRELVFTDTNALFGLLGLVANFDSQAREMVVELPPDVGLDLALPGQDEVELRVEPRGTVRIVDLEQAMAARTWCQDRLRVELDLTDALAPWHEGRWRIEARDGRAQARRLGTGQGGAEPGAHAAMDIAVLSSLYAGALSASEAVRLGLAVADAVAVQALDRLFASERLPLHLEWY